MRKFEFIYDGSGSKSYGQIGWCVREHIEYTNPPTVQIVGYGLANFDDAIRLVSSYTGGAPITFPTVAVTEF